MSKKSARHRLWILYRLDALAAEGIAEAASEDIHRTGQFSSWLFSTRVKDLLTEELVRRVQGKSPKGGALNRYVLTEEGRRVVAALSVDERRQLDALFDFTEPRLSVLETLADRREDPQGIAGKELGGRSARADAKTLARAGFVDIVSDNVPGLGDFYRLNDAGAELLARGRTQAARELAAEKRANRVRSDAQNAARAEAKRSAPFEPLEPLELFGELVADPADVGQLETDEVLVRVVLEDQPWLVRVAHETFVVHRGAVVVHRALRATGLTPDGEVRLQVDPGWCVTAMGPWVTVVGPVDHQGTSLLLRAIDAASRPGVPEWDKATVDDDETLQWPSEGERRAHRRWVTRLNEAVAPRRRY